MSSESELCVSGGEDSESEYSDDEDFVSPRPRSRKNSHKPSSSGVPLKKSRVESPVKEGSKQWGKPDLTQLCLGGLALFNMENETGSTNEIRDFIIEQFPYYKQLNCKNWSDFFGHITRRVAITNTENRDGHCKILTLNSSKCGPLKKKIENKLTQKMGSIKLTMSDPENFDSFLKNVRDYICTADESTESKHKVPVCDLVHEIFGGNFQIQMTIAEMATKIAEKYEYYADNDQKSNLKRNIRTQIEQRGVFKKCGHRGQKTLWKLDVSQTGLPHPSRISILPKPIQILIENSEQLFLLGNPSGKVGNFYFEGHDPNEITNKKSLNKIAVTTEGTPGQFKSYISWMTCLEPSTCPFSDNGEECCSFIFGNSDQSFSTITQSGISIGVTRQYMKRKALLPNYHIPARPLDVSDDEEASFVDFEYDGQEEDSDPDGDDDDEPVDKLSEPDKNNDDANQSDDSCKGPLDFLLQYPNHEFRKENCLSLWTTNNKKLKRQLKNFPRGAYKDMGSKARGMYPQMTPQAYQVFDSLRIALPFRKKYIIRAQKECRLLDLPTPQSSSSTKNFNIQLTQEELDKLVNERQLSTVGSKGETVIITIK